MSSMAGEDSYSRSQIVGTSRLVVDAPKSSEIGRSLGFNLGNHFLLIESYTDQVSLKL